MAKRKITNLLALAVLSLLGERPMHPYEALAVMRQRELSTVIKLNAGSLYSVFEALQNEKLITPLETQREGRYPERTVYATTKAGRAELADWLRELLCTPATEYNQFATALAFMGNLPPTEVSALLEAYSKHLREQIAAAISTLERANQLGVDHLFLIEDEYTRMLLEARFTFIQRLIGEINDGTLTTHIDGQLQWKIQRPELGLLKDENETNI